jgi:hypothetical protein
LMYNSLKSGSPLINSGCREIDEPHRRIASRQYGKTQISVFRSGSLYPQDKDWANGHGWTFSLRVLRPKTKKYVVLVAMQQEGVREKCFVTSMGYVSRRTEYLILHMNNECREVLLAAYMRSIRSCTP